MREKPTKPKKTKKNQKKPKKTKKNQKKQTRVRARLVRRLIWVEK